MKKEHLIIVLFAITLICLVLSGEHMNQKTSSGVDIVAASEASSSEAEITTEDLGESTGRGNVDESEKTETIVESSGEAAQIGETTALSTSSDLGSTSSASTSAPEATTQETSSAADDSQVPWDAAYPFRIRVNRAANCVTIYTLDENGEYTLPYKAFTCSVGLGEPSKRTPLGTFYLNERHVICLMVDQTYAKYAVRIEGQIMFHSVGYYTESSDSLEYKEYNKLGEAASLGCIRLRVGDCKWIFDNCPNGTEVEIYDDKDHPGPLGKPVIEKIDVKSPYRGWDPTDPDPENPWNQEESLYNTEDSTQESSGVTP